MQGRISGFFMTVFMMLPLAAIPLMSVFGVPQIGSLAGTPDDVGFLMEDPSERESAPSWNAETKTVSLEASAPDFSEGQTAASPWGDPSASNHEGHSGQDHSSPVPHLGSEGTDAAFQTASVDAVPMTWEAGIAKLQSWGITKFRIEPGLVPGTSQFACYLPQSTPGTVVRFEAEAASPVEALRNTLIQIENWNHSQAGTTAWAQ